MSSGVVRMHDQLRTLWKTRDKDVPLVLGLFVPGSKTEEAEERVVERWFVLLGHVFFYTLHQNSAEYSGAFLADIFSPVVSRVDSKTLDHFNCQEIQVVSVAICIS